MPRPRIQNEPDNRATAFTLIELLVVVVIVAILLTLALPALRRARLAGWKAVSLANVHSLCQAGAAYQSAQNGLLPLTPPRLKNDSFPSFPPHSKYAGIWCTWSAFGKYCDISWYSRTAGTAQYSQVGFFDQLAIRRPLNPYLFNGQIDGPKPGQAAIVRTAVRKIFQLPVCKDPSNKIGYQQNWATNSLLYEQLKPNSNPMLSCYDDVGTSYHWTEMWAHQMSNLWENFIHRHYGEPGGEGESLFFSKGNQGIQAVDPSRMIWINDESAKIVMASGVKNVAIKNGYEDINKGVVGYLDGHVRYVSIRPAGPMDRTRWADSPMEIPALNNPDYTAGVDPAIVQ